MPRPAHLLLAALLAGTPIARADDALYERAPIHYPTTRPTDPVARLGERLSSGQAKLDYDPKFGYLPALLRELKVPAASQTLVFSKTSFQRDLISPERPRALYFNDDVYVGFVQGGDVLELTATDPVSGPMFYSLRQRDLLRPRFVRQTDACLQCHATSMTGDLPGHVVRSVFPDADGQPILSAGTFRTTPASPLKQRWGGWYVTGTTAGQPHMGNVTAADKDAPEKTDFTAGTNLVDLKSKIDTAPYLTPHSDVVALMVMEHQASVHNLITRANYLTRSALYDAAALNQALGRPADYRSDSTVSRINNAVEPLVRGLLFCDEAPLTGPVKGTSDFAREFAKLGPRDAASRSLREFDLNTRLFKYPCSYLIDSPAIDALPGQARDLLFHRLHAVLTGQDQSKDFTHLTVADRRAILDILTATRKDLPAFFEFPK